MREIARGKYLSTTNYNEPISFYADGFLECEFFKSNTTVRKFISIEPLLGPIECELPSDVELVIVGALTGPSRKRVMEHAFWVDQIIKQFPYPEKILWKDSMYEYFLNAPPNTHTFIRK
jgi:hypothetical protein